MSHPTTYAVDFDGILCENAYPEIGADYYIDDKAMPPDLFVP